MLMHVDPSEEPCDSAARGTANEKVQRVPEGARMNSGWKPEGYSSVSPYLIAPGAGALIDFLVEAFGGVPLRRYEEPDGSILHAEVRIDDTVVMVGDAGPDWPATTSHLHVYVPDVDVAFDRAVEAGGVPVQEPSRRGDDPDRRGGVRDPAGNTWWIATQRPTTREGE